MASGSQVCRNNCADLPIAPMNRKNIAVFTAFHSMPRKLIVRSDRTSAWLKISVNDTESVRKYSIMMPMMKPKSPTRLTMKAFIAAAPALSFFQ